MANPNWKCPDDWSEWSQWLAFFRTQPDASVMEILEAFADRATSAVC